MKADKDHGAGETTPSAIALQTTGELLSSRHHNQDEQGIVNHGRVVKFIRNRKVAECNQVSRSPADTVLHALFPRAMEPCLGASQIGFFGRKWLSIESRDSPDVC